MFNMKLQSEYKDLDKYKDKFGYIYYVKKNTKILHNPYGPAVVNKDGHKEYWIDGKPYRLDGPAVIRSNGYEEYWINEEYLTKEEFEMHPERLKFLGKEHLICIK